MAKADDMVCDIPIDTDCGQSHPVWQSFGRQ